MIVEKDLPSGWKVVNLHDVLFFQEGPGVRKHQFTENGIKLLNVRNIVENKLIVDNTETYISEEEATTKYKHFLVDEGDLIIASSGIKVEYFHKKIAFAKNEDLPLCMNTSTIRFKALDNKVIDVKYFRYFLMTSLFTTQVQFHITGSAQLNFGPTHLKKMKVVLPPLPVQKKIVSILEKAEKLKEWRKEADELADEFLKSTFLEMFGSPGKNEMEWNLIPLEKVCSEIYRYPTFYGIDYIEKGTPIVRISNILPDGPLDPDVSNYVFFDSKINNKFPRTILEFNDIVMAVRGDGSTAKRIGLVNTFNLVGANISPNLLRIKADGFNLNPIYLFHFMTSYGGQLLLQKSVTRTAKKNITAGNVKKISIPIPPMLLQKKFATLVEDTKKMQVNQKQSQNALDSLFHALMQKAFRGELVC